MDDLSSRPLERTAGPFYFLALLFLVLPLVDYVMNVWPLNPGTVSWRYGALGLSGGFLLTPLLGLVMMLTGSMLFGHRGMRVMVGVVSAVLALLLALGMMLFVLDSLQVRRGVAADAMWAFDVGVIKAIVKIFTGAICSAWVALVAFRKLQDAPGRSKRTQNAPLVVGAAERAAAAND
ncbi:MAG TPA: hypothetical protein VGP87_01310 [Gemmatimonadales bacterium]|nr:hypothetical protein [Gemmatimonadales bacterium]